MVALAQARDPYSTYWSIKKKSGSRCFHAVVKWSLPRLQNVIQAHFHHLNWRKWVTWKIKQQIKGMHQWECMSWSHNHDRKLVMNVILEMCKKFAWFPFDTSQLNKNNNNLNVNAAGRLIHISRDMHSQITRPPQRTTRVSVISSAGQFSKMLSAQMRRLVINWQVFSSPLHKVEALEMN